MENGPKPHLSTYIHYVAYLYVAFHAPFLLAHVQLLINPDFRAMSTFLQGKEEHV